MTDASALSFDDLKMVAEGLGHLDGYDRVAKDGGREFVVKEYYKFGKGLRSLIASNIAVARPVIKDLNTRQNELVKQYANGSDKVADENLLEFMAAQREVLASSSGVTLKPIKLDELDLDKNPIPASVLSLIDPILDKESA